VRALAELDVLGDDGDGIVRRDPHEGVGREHVWAGRSTLGERPLEAQADHEPDARRAASKESPAAEHHSVFAASWMAARIRR
jgi:hypothetical protein